MLQLGAKSTAKLFPAMIKGFRRWWPLFAVVLYSSILGCYLMHVGSWDLSVPWNYPFPTYDEVWQLHLTKSLLDTGWILHNQYLGAPATADWYINAAPQTSSLHSLIMLLLGLFIHDAVRVQQVYYLLNFPLIALTTYAAARVLWIGRVPAVLVAILFAFLAYRFNYQFYAYLANYFCIPLALIPIYWTMLGRYVEEAVPLQSGDRVILRVFMSRSFLIGLGCIVLVALSDGYYAFFTLLLLGFATAIRLLRGDWRKPRQLFAPIMLIVLLMAVTSAMMLPLKNYQRSHWDEFYPGGVVDSSMAKHAFEAEVYSTSLKLLVTPLPGANRVPALAEIGNKMLASSNEARKYVRGVVVPLGLLGSGLLFLSFGLIAIRATGKEVSLGRGDPDSRQLGTLWVSAALGLFAFLCSIEGGIGTLIAFVYPSIRAYERFGVFLILILYFGAAAAATAFIHGSDSTRIRTLRTVVVVAVALLAHLDQVPANVWRGKETDRVRFLAEREFVRHVESDLPPNSMVYNYPYSQYLSDSLYYGWGAYGHIRLYMHSHTLRWSNGAGKNAPVERWHFRQSALPPEMLLAEMAAVGFRGIVVDRAVVKDEEYAALKMAAKAYSTGAPWEYPLSKLAFIPLPALGYRLVYNDSYEKPVQLDVTDRHAFDSSRPLPAELDRQAIIRALQRQVGSGVVRLDAASNPEIFRDTTKLAQGRGATAIDMKRLDGTMQCAIRGDGHVELNLRNGSDFPWILNVGPLPLTIGVNLLNADQSVMLWDPALRVRDRVEVAEGQSITLHYPLSAIGEKAAAVSQEKPVYARLALLQEGNAWSNKISCQIRVAP